MLRCCTVLAAAISAVAAALSIWFLVICITTYRADDLYLGTDTTDFTSLGTCVGVITKDQMEGAMEGFTNRKFNDDDFHCDDSGRNDWIGKAVSVSVHGLYHTWVTKTNGAGASVTSPGTATGLENEDGTYGFASVVRTAISATALAGCRSCAAETSYAYGGAGGTAYAGDKLAQKVQYPSVKREDVYHALKLVAEENVPVSCDVIYGMTGDDANGGAFADSDADTDAKAYAREYYRKIVDEHGSDDWPVAKIVGSCADDDVLAPTKLPGVGVAAAPNVGEADWFGSQLPDSMAIDDQTKLVLYAHCLGQFRYVASGHPIPYKGTFGVPTPGERPGPATDALHVYEVDDSDVNTIGENYTLKARLYQGQRFGYSTWAYVPMVLASTFLCADAAVFFVAEAGLPFALAGQRAYSTDPLIFKRNSLIMAATKKSSRVKRLIFGVLLVFVSLLFWGLYIVTPFNSLYESRMPRPHCEKNAEGFGEKSEHWTRDIMDLGYNGNKGGWKSDWDSSAYEICVVAFQVIILVALPFTTTGLFDICNRCRSRKSAGNSKTIATGTANESAAVPNSSRYRFHMAVSIPFLAFFAFVMILGQSVSGARFGMAWAQGVVGRELNDDGTGKYNPMLLAEEVVNQTVATILICIALGLVIGAAMQRYLIAYVGCFGAFFFFGWVALILVCFLPLVVVASIRSVIPDDADDDCETHFGGGKDDIALGACVFRNWSYIICLIAIVLLLLFITVIGLREALSECFRARRREVVELEYDTNIESHSLLRNQDSVNIPGGPPSGASVGPRLAAVSVGGYRSKDEGFYNFNTKTAGPAAAGQLLYAPRVQWDLSATGSTGAKNDARLLAAAGRRA